MAENKLVSKTMTDAKKNSYVVDENWIILYGKVQRKLWNISQNCTDLDGIISK